MAFGIPNKEQHNCYGGHLSFNIVLHQTHDTFFPHSFYVSEIRSCVVTGGISNHKEPGDGDDVTHVQELGHGSASCHPCP